MWSVLSQYLASYLRLGMCCNSSPLALALNNIQQAPLLCSYLQVNELLFQEALSPFHPPGIAETQIRLPCRRYLARVAGFQHVTMYRLSIYLALESHTVQPIQEQI